MALIAHTTIGITSEGSVRFTEVMLGSENVWPLICTSADDTSTSFCLINTSGWSTDTPNHMRRAMLPLRAVREWTAGPDLLMSVAIRQPPARLRSTNLPRAAGPSAGWHRSSP